MKKEEKTVLTKERIMNAAMETFGNNGYEATSLNSICSKYHIAKGLLYHNYKGKDELYLNCVKQCFDKLIEHLNSNVDKENQLESYFISRINFFHKYPYYKRIFYDAISYPPHHLKEEILKIKSKFDELNTKFLYEIVENLDLSDDISKEEVIDTFKQYQDFMNSKSQTNQEVDIKEHEKKCYKALQILLYGVIKR